MTKKKAIVKTAEKTEQKEEFSYCVGRPWDENKPDGSICVYAYGSQVHYGTMEDAEGFKKYVERQEEGKKYFVYKLVKV